MQRLWLPLAILALGASCSGREHDQSDGTYALTFLDSEVIRDTCGILGKQPVASGALRSLWNARLIVLGDTVRMYAELYEVVLVGEYQNARGENGRERFILDGSVNNVTANISGAECLVDIVTMHLEADTEDADHFRGVLSVRYESRQPLSCNCEYLVNFRAARQ